MSACQSSRQVIPIKVEIQLTVIAIPHLSTKVDECGRSNLSPLLTKEGIYPVVYFYLSNEVYSIG
jgi:hypothetical protein